jgi:hypothetical protein
MRRLPAWLNELLSIVIFAVGVVFVMFVTAGLAAWFYVLIEAAYANA